MESEYSGAFTVPMTISRTDGTHGLIVTGTGIVTIQDFNQTAEQIYPADSSLGECWYQLIDFMQVEALHLDSQGVRHLSALNSRAFKINPYFLIAIAGRKDLIFGMSRMWQAFLEKDYWETKVFRDSEKAKSWLKNGVRNKFNQEITFEETPPA